MFLLFSISFPSAGYSGGGGRDSLAFLNVGMGARPMGMAGAFTAVADDVNALYYNPAGLANLDNAQVTFIHQRWIVDLNYSYFGVALPIRSLGTFAGSLLHLGTPKIEAFDEFNNHAGTFSANDLAFSLSYGRNIIPGLSGGLTARFVKEVLDKSIATAFSVDLGVLYDLGKDTRIGGFIGNIGTSIKHIAESPLESSKQAGVLRLGISTYGLSPKFLTSLEFTKQFDDDPEIRVGGEYVVSDSFVTRMGYSHEFGGRQTGGINGISGGVGFRYSSIVIDYALSPWGDLGMTHMFGLTYQGSVKTAKEPKVLEEKVAAAPSDDEELANYANREKKNQHDSGPFQKEDKQQKTLENAVDMLKQGKAKESLSILTALSKQQPRDARIYLFTGLALKSLDKTDEAKKYFEFTVKLAPEGSKIQSLAQGYLDKLPR